MSPALFPDLSYIWAQSTTLVDNGGGGSTNVLFTMDPDTSQCALVLVQINKPSLPQKNDISTSEVPLPKFRLLNKHLADLISSMLKPHSVALP